MEARFARGGAGANVEVRVANSGRGVLAESGSEGALPGSARGKRGGWSVIATSAVAATTAD